MACTAVRVWFSASFENCIVILNLA
jgi:hypothetical protein